jgi:hypothetical protein
MVDEQMPDGVNTSLQPYLYGGPYAHPEEIFGQHYAAWEGYHAAYRQALFDEVWAALLMGRALIPLDQLKKPLIKWKAWQKNPATIEQVLAWQRQLRPAAWAVVTGRRYGFFVLDFDGPRGARTMNSLQLHPHVRTGSGGHHVYLEYPGHLEIRTLNHKTAHCLNAALPGTDLKGNGGCAVFAGVSQKGRYQWLRPMWPDRCPPQVYDLLVQVIAASRCTGPQGSSSNGRANHSNIPGVAVDGQRIPVDTLLRWGLERATGGRNAAGFDLACQLRDHGYEETEAAAVLAEYVRRVGDYNQKGQYEPYTMAEAQASLAQAYSRPAREPWCFAVTTPAGPSSPRLCTSPLPLSPAAITSPPLPPSSGSPSSKPASSPPPPAGPRLVVPDGPHPGGRRRILYEPPLTPIVEASLDALDHRYQNDPHLFVRGNQLTEIVRDEQDRYHLRRISAERMTAHLDKAVEYLQRTKQGFKDIFPPLLVIDQILARTADELPFPPLAGIVKSPIMRADGTVLERATPGFDAATHYFCAMDEAVASLGVPMAPTVADVSGAISLLDEMVCDVCFADPPAVYRANYFAVLLTPLVRLMVDDNLPLFAIDATKPRSGKGLLAAIVGVLANGYPTPVTTGPEPGESGEWRKKLTTFLLGGETIVTIDNVVFTLNCAELCALVTTRHYTDRILGSNASMTADPMNSMWILTGNALQPAGDLVKRCFWVRLDCQRNDPEKRTGFKHPELLSWVATNRALLLRALLTLARAWVIAGQPAPQGIAPFGGFDRWARVVGGILQHAGLRQFFQDPEQAYSDPDAEQWLPFLGAVGDVTYWDRFTIADLAKVAQDVQWIGGRNIPSDNASKLRDHLPDELAREVDTAKFRAALGYAFRKKKNTYYGPDNIHIAHTGDETRDGAVLWQVRRASQAQPGAAPAPSSPSPALPPPSTSATAPPAPSTPPAVGDVRHKDGKAYRFNGSKWVKDHE